MSDPERPVLPAFVTRYISPAEYEKLLSEQTPEPIEPCQQCGGFHDAAQPSETVHPPGGAVTNWRRSAR